MNLTCLKKLGLLVFILSFSILSQSQTLDRRYAGLSIGMSKETVMDLVTERLTKIYENNENDVVKYQRKNNGRSIGSKKKLARFLAEMEEGVRNVLSGSDDWGSVGLYQEFYKEYGVDIEKLLGKNFSVPGFINLHSGNAPKLSVKFRKGRLSEIRASVALAGDNEVSDAPYSTSSLTEFDEVIENNLGEFSRKTTETETFLCDKQWPVYTVRYVVENDDMKAVINLYYRHSFRWVYSEAPMGYQQAEYCEVVGNGAYLKEYDFVLTGE